MTRMTKRAAKMAQRLSKRVTRVRLTRLWRGRKKGAEVDLAPNVAHELLKRQIAEPVEKQVPAVEQPEPKGSAETEQQPQDADSGGEISADEADGAEDADDETADTSAPKRARSKKKQ